MEDKCLVQFEYSKTVGFDKSSQEYNDMKEIEKKIIVAFNIAVRQFLMGEDLEVFIMFTNNEHIKKVNKEQRDLNEPTDVLSFPMMEACDGAAVCNDFDINPETDRIMMGDIIVSLDAAAMQAVQYGHSLTREITFLAVHGLLHLMGYDHNVLPREELMFDKQKEILEEAGITRN